MLMQAAADTMTKLTEVGALTPAEDGTFSEGDARRARLYRALERSGLPLDALVQAVERASRLVNAQPSPGREVHVLSDLQRTAVMTGRADVPRGVRVLALEPGRAVPNRGIAAVHVTEGAAVIELAGSTAGAVTTEPVPITIRIGGERGERDRGEIAARGLATPREGSVVTVSLPAQSLAPGWWVGEAALEPDELRADDRRRFAWRVAPPARVTATPEAGGFVAERLGASWAIVLSSLSFLISFGLLSVIQMTPHATTGKETDVTSGKQAVVADGQGRDVVITGGESPAGARNILQPPADPALVGQANRGLASRGVSWHWGLSGSPGPIVAPQVSIIDGVQVTRRYRLDGAGAGDTLATVNGEPWLIRSGTLVLLGSRLDTAWTALPAAPGFVPFVDALVNRLVRGEVDVTMSEGAPRVEFRLRGADTVGATVFGPDPRESDLTPASASVAIAALGGEERAEVLNDSAFASEGFSGTRRADISGLLLGLAVLLAFTELGVATRTR